MNISGTQNRRYLYNSEPYASEYKELHRFMDIDLTEFLGKIAEKVVLLNTSDWKRDKQALMEAALSDDPDDRRLVWLVSGFGTKLHTERETFIEDTPAFRFMRRDTEYAPDLFGYIVEVKGSENGVVKGNVFEIGDFADYALYVRRTAMPLEYLTLTYSNEWGDLAGQTIDVPHYEFARDYRMYVAESGHLEGISYHPLAHNMYGMAGLLHQERENRMKLPVGSPAAHLELLALKLADIRGESQPHRARSPTRRAARKPAQKPMREPVPEQAPQAPAATQETSIASRLATATKVAEASRGYARTNKTINNERTL